LGQSIRSYRSGRRPVNRAAPAPDRSRCRAPCGGWSGLAIRQSQMICPMRSRECARWSEPGTELGKLDVVNPVTDIPGARGCRARAVLSALPRRDVVHADDGGGGEAEASSARVACRPPSSVSASAAVRTSISGIRATASSTVFTRSLIGPSRAWCPTKPAAVAQAIQVIDHLLDAAAVVDADVGDVLARRADIVEDHRNAAVGELVDQRGSISDTMAARPPRAARSSAGCWPRVARTGSRCWPSPPRSAAWAPASTAL